MNEIIDCLLDVSFASCAKLVSYKLASCSKETRISDDRGSMGPAN